MKYSALVFIAELTSTAAIAQVAPATSRQEVPVTTVALFSSGVGYFEHSGIVRGDGTTELRFRTSQMNDVLKSLVLQDEGGGRVTTITYSSQDPLSKSLRSFQVDITANPSMAQLLNQLRGAHVTIQSQAEHLSGTILGVETRHRQQNDKDAVIDVPVLNLLAGAMIRSVELQSVTSLTFDDPQLQDELTKALAALSQSRDQDKKPVLINFIGSGERRVRVGYVVETPVWKTSYRLILDDKSARLQGWAIVENQTESDWNNVSLSLVSGRPISFVMDLYAPMYLTRPTVVQARYEELHPQIYAGGFNQDSISSAGSAGGAVNKRPFAMAAPASPRRIGYDAQGRPVTAQLSEVVVTSAEIDYAAESVRSMASTAQLGELFEYTVKNVTLPRQKSAMIPIVTESVDIERVSIYNASVLATNPLNGVRLKNTTGKSLLQGPLTVLEKGGYAGDAQIDNLPAGQERLVSYGVDLQMLVNSTRNSMTSAVVTAKIAKGLLYVDRRLVASQEYLADNKSDKEKVLVVEHPLRQNWTLVDSPKPYEITASVYRFKVAAPAKKTTSLVIKEQSVQTQTMAMLGTDIMQLLAYSRSGEIPTDVRAAVGKAAQLMAAVNDVERQIAQHAQQIADIGTEQNRIRENMKTVGQTSQYYQRLLAKLNDQESSIERLQHERDDLLVKRDAARKDLEDYLRDLTVG
jgi:flagellin-like hook-associated protein FlgL